MITIKPFRKQDDPKAIGFSEIGMNFDRYFTSTLIRRAYAGWFWYACKQETTEILAAYDDDVLLGLMCLNVKDRPMIDVPWYQKLYCRLVLVLSDILRLNLQGYENINERLLSAFKKTNDPYGEIVYFACDPEKRGSGVGRFLMSALEEKYRGKQFYVFSDTDCNVGFYEHVGFQVYGKESYTYEGQKKAVLECMILAKVL